MLVHRLVLATRVLAALAAVEAGGLVTYAVYDTVQAIRIGTVGPSAVSNAPALFLQMLIVGGLGFGLLLIARGWLRSRLWVRSPFLLAQILALVLGIPLAQYPDGGVKVAGVALVAIAAAGVILALTPGVNRALSDPSEAKRGK